MSLESLGALKSLIQVREQNANVQEEGRERVQQSVQQQGTSEAQRIDQLGLEKLKAEYEVALSDARVKRLQAQESREAKGLVVTQLAAIGGLALSAGSNIYDMMKSGKSEDKNNDPNKKDSVFDNPAKGDLMGGQRLNSVNNGIDNNAFGSGTSDAKNIATQSEGSTGSSIFSISGDTVVRTNVSGSGTITGGKTDKDSISGGIMISNMDQMRNSLNGTEFATMGDDKKLQLTELGKSRFGVESIDQLNSTKFQELLNNNPQVASQLFEGAKKDVNQEQAAGFNAFAKSGKLNSIDISTSSPVQGTAFDKFKTNNKDMVSGYFDGIGRTKGVGATTYDGFKSGLNALVSTAQDVVPLFDAMLKMKDRLENTREELKAAQEKLAAAMRKLKAIEEAMINPGSNQGDVQDTQMKN